MDVVSYHRPRSGGPSVYKVSLAVPEAPTSAPACGGVEPEPHPVRARHAPGKHVPQQRIGRRADVGRRTRGADDPADGQLARPSGAVPVPVPGAVRHRAVRRQPHPQVVLVF